MMVLFLYNLFTKLISKYQKIKIYVKYEKKNWNKRKIYALDQNVLRNIGIIFESIFLLIQREQFRM